MSTVQDTSSLYTTVKNTSGRRMTYSFLPPHGRTLDADEEFTFFGNIDFAIARGDRAEGLKRLKGFEAAMEQKLLQVLSTPIPILIDATTHVSKQLHLNNGVLGVTDPTWDTSVSEDPDVV